MSYFEEEGWPSLKPPGLTYETAGSTPFCRSV
jgi:hypothetical protein